MNEENKVNYYSVIPATVRYDKRLKFAERKIEKEQKALSEKVEDLETTIWSNH